MTSMTIGKVAAATGVNVETIRFYERQGLIEQPSKPVYGYRSYPEQTVRRVRFVRRAQTLGFSLREIVELLSLLATKDAGAGDVQRRATEKLRDMAEKIERLRRISVGLTTLLDRCPGEGGLHCCSILDALQGDELLFGERDSCKP